MVIHDSLGHLPGSGKEISALVDNKYCMSYPTHIRGSSAVEQLQECIDLKCVLEPIVVIKKALQCVVCFSQG